MEPAIEQLIDHVERYSAAGDRLLERLAAQRIANDEDIERLRAGATLSQSTRATNSAVRSRELTRILAEFEASRRATRAAVVVAAFAEGMSVADIAEIFGVSRQLANRFVKEARNLGYLPGPASAPG